MKTCAKILREGSDLANTLLLQALLDIHQSKPMRVIMKKHEELEHLKKIYEKRILKKEFKLTKKLMGILPKSSEYCVPIRIVGMAYNPFIDDDIGDCYFDYKQAVLLRFWSSRI